MGGVRAGQWQLEQVDADKRSLSVQRSCGRRDRRLRNREKARSSERKG